MHLCSFVHLCVGVLTAAVWVCGSWGRPVHMWAVGAVSYGLVKICFNKKNKCSDRSWLMLNGKTAIIHCRFINITYMMTLYIHREMCCCDTKLHWEDHCYSWKPWAGSWERKLSCGIKAARICGLINLNWVTWCSQIRRRRFTHPEWNARKRIESKWTGLEWPSSGPNQDPAK